jgi:hypothetical protein
MLSAIWLPVSYLVLSEDQKNPFVAMHDNIRGVTGMVTSVKVLTATLTRWRLTFICLSYKISVPTSQRKKSSSVIKTTSLILCRKWSVVFVRTVRNTQLKYTGKIQSCIMLQWMVYIYLGSWKSLEEQHLNYNIKVYTCDQIWEWIFETHSKSILSTCT